VRGIHRLTDAGRGDADVTMLWSVYRVHPVEECRGDALGVVETPAARVLAV